MSARPAHEAETSPAKYTRRGVEDDVYYTCRISRTTSSGLRLSLRHSFELDINQELYGMPEYLSALNSASLNESATLFRRKYYGERHAGYIMYVTDAAQKAALTLRQDI
ncbi:hypothetical protein KIF59_04530 [Enterobacter cloacae subsp. cloacae]|nr:hypothetical protein [Enterobacter cloacae subsp. cloacae]